MLESRTSYGDSRDGGAARTESGSGSGSGVLILLDDNDDDNNNNTSPRGETQKRTQRVWDWRKGMRPNSTAGDALRILRLGLARDLSRGWLEGEV